MDGNWSSGFGLRIDDGMEYSTGCCLQVHVDMVSG